MPLYHVNVPQYDDVLNILEVTEFSSDFQLEKHK